MSTDGQSLLGIRAARLRATSAQAGSPVVPRSRHDRRAERRAHARRTRTPQGVRARLALAGAMHRFADALAPRAEDLGHPAR